MSVTLAGHSLHDNELLVVYTRELILLLIGVSRNNLSYMFGGPKRGRVY